MQSSIWDGKRYSKSLMLFLLPGLLGVLMFYVIPFISGFRFSITDGTYEQNIVGISNYKAVLGNKLFLIGLKNSIVLSLICAPTVWFLGFIVASMLHRLKRSTKIISSSIFLPYLMPSVAVISIWQLIFNDNGPISRLCYIFINEPINFFDGNFMRIPVIMLFIWKNLGFAVIIYTSAMQGISDSLYEYATLEGAGFGKQTYYITLPHIIPTIFLIMVLEWINSFKIFKEIYLLYNSKSELSIYTLQNYMNRMFERLNYQQVTTAAYIFATIIFTFFAILYIVQKIIINKIEGYS